MSRPDRTRKHLGAAAGINGLCALAVTGALIGFGVSGAAASTGASSAKGSVGWSAVLTAGKEIPKQAVANSAGQGVFAGTLQGSKLSYTLTFSKLTGPATMAHIHLGKAGVAGGVLVALCAPCKSPVKGTVTVSPAVQKDFAKHALYVNVHTAKNPNGEIRGQLIGGTGTTGNNG